MRHNGQLCNATRPKGAQIIVLADYRRDRGPDEAEQWRRFREAKIAAEADPSDRTRANLVEAYWCWQNAFVRTA